MPKALAVALLLLLTAACSGDGPSEFQVSDLVGTYVYQESFAPTGTSWVCGGQGALTLQVAGGQVTGTISSRGQCVQADTTIAYAHEGEIREGNLEGVTIRFRTPLCRVEGVLTSSDPRQAGSLGGSLFCANGLGAVAAPQSGSWLAER
jgi:hypothetical protein